MVFLDDYPNIIPVVSDARLYMNKHPALYDLVYLDAYSGWLSILAHLTTLEFFTQVKSTLAPGGIAMMNLAGRLDEPHTERFDGIVTTMGHVYDDRQIYRTKSHSDRSVINIFIVFGDDLTRHDRQIAIDDETRQFHYQCVEPSTYQDRKGVLLTDDYSPIEYLESRTFHSD